MPRGGGGRLEHGGPELRGRIPHKGEAQSCSPLHNGRGPRRGRDGALSGGTEMGTPREAGKGPPGGRSSEGMRPPRRRRRRTAGPCGPPTPKGGPTVTLRVPGPPRGRGPGRASPDTVRKQKTPHRPNGRPRAEGRTAGRSARQARCSLPPQSPAARPAGPQHRHRPRRRTGPATTARAAAPSFPRHRPCSSAPPPRQGGAPGSGPLRGLPVPRTRLRVSSRPPPAHAYLAGPFLGPRAALGPAERHGVSWAAGGSKPAAAAPAPPPGSGTTAAPQAGRKRHCAHGDPRRRRQGRPGHAYLRSPLAAAAPHRAPPGRPPPISPRLPSLPIGGLFARPLPRSFFIGSRPPAPPLASRTRRPTGSPGCQSSGEGGTTLAPTRCGRAGCDGARRPRRATC